MKSDPPSVDMHSSRLARGLLLHPTAELRYPRLILHKTGRTRVRFEILQIQFRLESLRIEPVLDD